MHVFHFKDVHSYQYYNLLDLECKG